MIYNIAKNNKIFINKIKKWHENFNWEKFRVPVAQFISIQWNI